MIWPCFLIPDIFLPKVIKTFTILQDFSEFLKNSGDEVDLEQTPKVRQEKNNTSEPRDDSIKTSVSAATESANDNSDNKKESDPPKAVGTLPLTQPPKVPVKPEAAQKLEAAETPKAARTQVKIFFFLK